MLLRQYTRKKNFNILRGCSKMFIDPRSYQVYFMRLDMSCKDIWISKKHFSEITVKKNEL